MAEISTLKIPAKDTPCAWKKSLSAAITTPATLGLLALLLSSCASVSVTNLKRDEHFAPTAPPLEIFLMPFAVEDSALRVDRKGRDLADFKAGLKANMSRELLERLPAHAAQARILSPDTKPPRGNYWLLQGHFTRVNQGSRLLRSTVGFGAGGTKMESTIAVYHLSGAKPTKILEFETTGGSNITQGIGGIIAVPLSGPMAFTSLYHAADGIRSGVSFDTARTAREITATLSEYLHEKNLLFERPPISPKKLGVLRFDILPTSKVNTPPSTTPVKKTASP